MWVRAFGMWVRAFGWFASVFDAVLRRANACRKLGRAAAGNRGVEEPGRAAAMSELPDEFSVSLKPR